MNKTRLTEEVFKESTRTPSALGAGMNCRAAEGGLYFGYDYP